MSDKKQTAIQYLVEQIKSDQNQKSLSASEWMQVINQAKQMEKEQIMMAVKDSWYMAKGSNFQEPQAQQYYNETYGK